MAFLLARSSALQWLRRQGKDVSALQRMGLRVLDFEADFVHIERHKELLDSLKRPIHLVVFVRDYRRRSRAIRSHLLRLPQGIYPAYMIERAVFCSAPELIMIEMATTLDEDELLFLGCELCGSYGFNQQGKLVERPRLCDSVTIAEFAGTCAGVHGRKRLARVVPRVLDGAASPMEIALAICLTTPVAQGGLGLPTPQLNKPLPVDGPARRLWDGKTIAPDLLWEFEDQDEVASTDKEAAKNAAKGKGVAIEYDSDENHTGAEKIARDARRRNTLEAMGYHVITVTNEQFSETRELERVGMLVARYLGVPFEEAIDEAWLARTSFHAKMRRIAMHPELLFGE